MNRVLIQRYLYYAFIGLNVLLILTGIALFILGNVKYWDYWYIYSGSFFGGPLFVLALLMILYGLLGVYGGWKHDKVSCMIYTAIPAISMFIRFIYWIEMWSRRIGVDNWHYGMVGFEVLFLAVAIAFMWI